MAGAKPRGRAASCSGLALVLIPAIAAILLVGVVIPIGVRQREKARQASCISNLKSLAMATLTYASEWDNRLPPAPKLKTLPSLEQGRTESVDDLSRYFAADDWHVRIRYRNNNVFICPSTRSLYSYDFNPYVYGQGLEGIRKPSLAPLEYDAGFVTGSPPGPHQKGYNTTYCDGHSFWMPGAYGRRAWPSLTLTGE